MPFIGNQPALNYTSFAKQDFTTSATTSYTLNNPVTNENEIALFINFVRQEPTTAYTASNTNLNLTSATSASDDMYCVFLGKAVQTVNPPAGSVGISQLSATGTKDATTFLRGDNTFASAGIAGISTSSTSGTAISIDSSNRVTMASMPSFAAFNLDGTNWNSGKFSGSADYNTGSHYNTSNGTFTCPIAGKYFVYTGVLANTGSGRIEGEITLNGSVKINYNGDGTNTYSGATGSCILSCSANDTIESKRTDGTAYATAHPNHYFGVQFLG